MLKTGRRDFLKAGVGAAAAAGSLWPLAATRAFAGESPAGKRAKVSAVRGTDLIRMTRDALDALGGIRTVVDKNDRVFVKPNFVNIGVTPLSRYAQLVDNTWWNRGTFDHGSPETIAQVYLDIVKAVKTHLAIVDLSIGLEADGPSKGQGGTTVDMKQRLGSWAVLASTDIVAADASAARVMSHDPMKVKQLTMGHAMGLGEIREEAIDVVGEKLANLRVDWKPARLKGHKVKK